VFQKRLRSDFLST